MKFDLLPEAHGRFVSDCDCDAQVLITSNEFKKNYLGITDQLNEATYEEVASLIDGNFLLQNVRYKQLQRAKFDHFEDNTMVFSVPSSENNKNNIVYDVRVQFVNWDEIGNDTDFNFNEKARLLLWTSDIKLHCTDPSFLYWGYQYLLTAIDASIYPEERKPVVRNPQERGIVCKHARLVLQVLPFNMGYIAQEMKNQFGE